MALPPAVDRIAACYDLEPAYFEGLEAVGPFALRSPGVGPLPLILAVPHGGEGQSADPVRAQGCADPDDHSMAMALAMFQELRSSAEAPALVAVHLHRKWVDVNRGKPYSSLDSAYDGPDGEAAYRAFHGTIEELVAAYAARGEAPLLVDLHGNSHRALRGCVEPAVGGPTADFLPALSRRYGEDPAAYLWHGPHALLASLEAHQIAVWRGPPIFNGGFTVRHYSQQHGINCLQLEFHREYRATAAVAQATGRRLAAALRAFVRRYPCEPPAAAAAV